MFFCKKSLTDVQFFNGFCDYHSHILPGVDDGVKCVDDAIEVLRWYEELGVTRVTLTPHIMEDFPRNNSDRLRSEFERFNESYDGSIELSLAAEYMIDSMFERHLDGGDLLTISDNYLLVESSYIEPPLNFFGRLEAIMQRGYFVVLAHPERYSFLSSDDYRRLKEKGVLFQLNLLSLLGGYGREAAKRAKSLIDLSYYDLIGSDLHTLNFHRKHLTTTKLPKSLIAKLRDLQSQPTLHTKPIL